VNKQSGTQLTKVVQKEKDPGEGVGWSRSERPSFLEKLEREKCHGHKDGESKKDDPADTSGGGGPKRLPRKQGGESLDHPEHGRKVKGKGKGGGNWNTQNRDFARGERGGGKKTGGRQKSVREQKKLRSQGTAPLHQKLSTTRGGKEKGKSQDNKRKGHRPGPRPRGQKGTRKATRTDWGGRKENSKESLLLQGARTS